MLSPVFALVGFFACFVGGITGERDDGSLNIWWKVGFGCFIMALFLQTQWGITLQEMLHRLYPIL